MITIEVCQRLMDRRFNGKPRYHASVQNTKGGFGVGNTPAEAIGDLIKSHPKLTNIAIKYLGVLAR